MDMNELKGRVLKVNLARPMKGALQPNGNRASTSLSFFLSFFPFSICALVSDVLVCNFSLGIRGMVKRACKTSGAIRWFVSPSTLIFFPWFQLLIAFRCSRTVSSDWRRRPDWRRRRCNREQKRWRCYGGVMLMVMVIKMNHMVKLLM